MRSDAQLRSDVVAELNWDPAITATDVGVIVKDGVVTLTGHPSSHAEKYAIERAAQRVKGVKALAIEMPVKLAADYTRTDADIAAAVERAIEWNVLVPDDKIHPMLENGWVTLNGEVEWDYQRRAAENAVRDLLGVTGVTNLVAVKPKFTAADVEKKIQEALERQAGREAERIKIEVNGAHVTLSGKVHSWAERKAAQGAAWSAPGVANVINKLLVEA
ncbi:periplasmic protein [Variovorax sp. PBS-H4]|uniref:BON domain-containing protein n=1 Tax=Variovorax sp. PBS-H4 TaxID=434008 RepID=UPI001317D0F3|nr:BON domain-containing protein [Variovorax sp. PBS-H4]VTU35992.1 periplasmic protein [Variovorax sp. PBS-H4]